MKLRAERIVLFHILHKRAKAGQRRVFNRGAGMASGAFGRKFQIAVAFFQDASIGEHCSVGQNVFVAPGVKIGNFCKIQNNVSVYDGVELGDYVFCGPSMVFTNVQRPRCKYPQAGHQFYLKTPVCEGASIGANATIVCGHRIGRHAFIAAGSVVTKDVPDHAIMMGVPARQRGWACECGETLDEALRCPKCGRKYRQGPDGLEEVTE